MLTAIRLRDRRYLPGPFVSAFQLRCVEMTKFVSEEVAVERALSGLVEVLETVTEPRGRQGRRHLLTDILAIAVLGCMCGCDDAEALEDWARKEESWLLDFLELPFGVPSQDTYLRVLAAIDEREFRGAFRAWATQTFRRGMGRGQIALDGKTARRSGDKAFEKKAVHMVSALACEHDLVLGQQPTSDKSNELNAIRALLDLLHLKGSLVSIDAIGCQRDIARTVRRRGGDYLFTLKDNQAALRQSVVDLFEAVEQQTARPSGEDPLAVVSVYEHVDAGHGRIETRTTHVLEAWGDWVPEAERWSGLATLIRVQSHREHEGTGVIEEQVRYYISSRKLTAEQAHEHIRAHWRIENCLHYVLDVTFKEDSYRARKQNAANNFIVIRHFALNLLRTVKQKKYSLTRTRRLCDYDLQFRENLLGELWGA